MMDSSASLTGKASPADPRRLRLWLAATLFGVLIGLCNIPETSLRSLKSIVRAHPVHAHVAVVGIDDKSLAAIGQWPFPRSNYARLVDRLFALGADRVFLNINFPSASNPREDQAFAQALARHRGRVFLASRFVEHDGGIRESVLPLSMFRERARIVNVSYSTNEKAVATTLPYSYSRGNERVETIAPAMAGIGLAREGAFVVDTSIKLSSIPILGMSEILKGKPVEGELRGHDVIVGATSDQLQDFVIVNPLGRISSTMFFAMGAETLYGAAPIDIGWLPIFAMASCLVFVCRLLKKNGHKIALLSASACLLPVVFVAVPTNLETKILPGVGVLAFAAVVAFYGAFRDAMRARATVNQVSGLQNLTALRQLERRPGHRLVIARIHNFAEATAALPPEDEATLVGQIATRLKLGMMDAELYHGDNGVFAWLAAEDLAIIGDRLDALHALFRSPVNVSGQNVDLVVTFGFDDDDERSMANRLGSALVAAAEASADGAKWREFDKAKLADAAWKLSLLSQLDAAIDEGDLWVAYQPKLDLVTRKLVGAEALVRWTHPEKGAISPIEFVAAAEQHNRIEKLTMHVLDRAVLACATVNAHGIPFGIAVNLSTRLLEDRSIVDAVAATLAYHRLDPARLTLEITETATLTSAMSLDVLAELRALGLRISIDDYGTGLSTLDYLKKIPASEIKIDRSFVQSMLSGGSDLLMINSTIQLAHSLGHVVVAEGVETDEVLARLAELQCDIAQGYRIGRPMTFQDLARRLLAERKNAA